MLSFSVLRLNNAKYKVIKNSNKMCLNYTIVKTERFIYMLDYTYYITSFPQQSLRKGALLGFKKGKIEF